uniref:Uncharacterized protein n=1 Tax=Timema shepardi TaxID=629360 RepID=A0A7R9B6S9_TIMSH|nr:unnamed protein product [Timema shepardi]
MSDLVPMGINSHRLEMHRLRRLDESDDMAGFKGKPPKCPTSEGGKAIQIITCLFQCIIGCIMTEMGVMSNNQINLTSAEALIRKKAGDQAEIGIELLKVCAETVGTQPDQCIAGAKTCECVLESGLISQMG